MVEKKTAAVSLRGFTNDDETVPEHSRKAAAQKNNILELMLGQIANYGLSYHETLLSRFQLQLTIYDQLFTFTMDSNKQVSISWILTRYILNRVKDREIYFRDLIALRETVNLLKAGGHRRHLGEIPDTDEDMSPSLEIIVVVKRLRLVHSDLPNLVKTETNQESNLV